MLKVPGDKGLGTHLPTRLVHNGIFEIRKAGRKSGLKNTPVHRGYIEKAKEPLDLSAGWPGPNHLGREIVDRCYGGSADVARNLTGFCT